jgi:hypothetical protein
MFPENAVWYRAIQPRHWNTALQTNHTHTISSRFNGGRLSYPQFDVLYLAQDHAVALFEVQALLGSPYGNYIPQPAQAWTILNIQVDLKFIADLTIAGSHASLQTTVQELTGDWIGYKQRMRSNFLTVPTGLSPTQELGLALFAVPDLEGFKTISAKVPDKKTLVVFPQKLKSGSFIRFSNKATNQQHTIQSAP